VPNDFRLEQPDHRLGERIIVGIATAADRRFDAGRGEPLGAGTPYTR
jgi:hypothetical protein